MSVCKECGFEWSSLRQGHCAVCHQQFASQGVSDHHWIGEEHVDIELLPLERRKQFSKDRAGVWHYGPKRPQSLQHRAARP